MDTPGLQHTTILVVEDNDGINALITKVLKRGGYDCCSAKTGAEAVSLCVDTGRYTLMLLDYKLPDMTGKDVVELLAQKGHTIPFITMTGFGDQQTAVTMMKLGAREYIVKESDFINRIPHIVGQVVNELETETQLALSRKDLAKALEQSQQRQKETEALLKGTKAILLGGDFTSVARTLFDICRDLIHVQSGYVALLSPNGRENEVLFLEAGNLPCTVDPSLPMPIRGLRAEAYATGKPAVENDFTGSEWVRFMPAGHVHMQNVMFIPLTIEGKTVGIIGLANKPEGFSEDDQRIGTAFGELAAIALRNSRDRDALLESEQRLHHSQKMQVIGQLAGGVAHDFNNILGGITGYADLLKLKYRNDPETRAHAEKISLSAQKASNLTRQLLTFARKVPMAKSRFDVHASIASTIDMFGQTIDKKIVVESDLAAKPSLLFIDQSMFENSLLNICINARDAMPNGGTLHLVTTVRWIDEDALADPLFKCIPGRYLNLSVADTGTGMDEATRKRIFEPFFTTKELGKGTGLGLASVYGFVKQHDGYITVTSRLGEGTCFSLYFPVAEIIPPVQQQETIDLEHLRGTGRILVVDDEESIRDTLLTQLEKMGYQVTACNDGLDGIRYYRDHHNDIDLVILDIIMPIMGGVECFREMKLIHPGVRALFMSGYSGESQTNVLLNEGIREFIQKPFNSKDIAVCLHRMLSAPAAVPDNNHPHQDPPPAPDDGNEKHR